MGAEEGYALKKARDIYHQAAWPQGERSPPAIVCPAGCSALSPIPRWGRRGAPHSLLQPRCGLGTRGQAEQRWQEPGWQGRAQPAPPRGRSHPARSPRRVEIHRPGSPAPGAKQLGSLHPESQPCPRGRAEGPLGLPVHPIPFALIPAGLSPQAHLGGGTASPPALIASPAHERRAAKPASTMVGCLHLSWGPHHGDRGDPHVPTAGRAAAGEASPRVSSPRWRKRR